MRKTVGKLAMVLCAVTVALLGNSEHAEAAGNATMLPDSAIQVDYQYESMEVTGGQNTVIYYSDNANAAEWESIPVKDGKAVFDISWIKPSLTTRIYLRGDKDTLVTARYLEAQEKLSADFVGDISAADVVDIDKWKEIYDKYPNFTSETGYILFFTKQGGAETAFFDVDRIEWKKETTGNWRDFDELNLAQMNAKGVTLYFRIKAVNDADTDDGISGKRYSSEAKVILQKIAMAPTVNVNNASMTLGIRNGMEYSLDKKEWYLVPVYAKGATSDAVAVPVVPFDVLPTTNRRVSSIAVPLVLDVPANAKIDESLITANPGKYQYETNEDGEITGIYVYARTAASARKAASKTVEVLIPFGTTEPDIANDITITYQNTKSGTGGIMLTNNTTATNPTIYQYAIVDDPDTLTPEELSGLKWSTLKAAKTLKVSSSKALPGQYFIFRVAPESKAELPSNYEKYPYQIQYDKVTYAAFSTTSLYPGGVISAVTSNNAISGDITYTWERSQTLTGTYAKITSGVGYANSKYTIKEEDVGYYIRVVISNTSSTGETASVTSKSSGKIAKDPMASVSPTPTPSATPTTTP
ncbi:MAG: hypothetical protein IJW37_06160 [Lachnospiraceae bacterium]|nr:hypothetical protein [Lachnospiraceae bacterium]